MDIELNEKQIKKYLLDYVKDEESGLIIVDDKVGKILRRFRKSFME